MRRLIILSLLLTTVSLSAQTFEWTKGDKTPPSHPKEVQVTDQTSVSGTEERQTGLAGVYTSDSQGSKTAYGEIYSGEEMTGSHPALPLGTLLRVTNTENGKTVVVRVTDRGKECADCLITLSAVAADQLGINGPSPVSLERSGFSNWNPAPPVAVAPAPVTYSAAVPSSKKTVETVTPAPGAQAGVNHREVDSAPATYNRYPRIARPTGEAAATEQEGVAPPPPTVPEGQAARGASIPLGTETPPAGAEQYAIQLAAYSNEAYALRRVSELQDQGMQDVYYRSVTKPNGEVINRVYAGTYPSAAAAQIAARTIQGQFNLAGIVTRL